MPNAQTQKYKNMKIQKYKYKNTNTKKNTQIQHMTKCQKEPTCGIFLKRGLFQSRTVVQGLVFTPFNILITIINDKGYNSTLPTDAAGTITSPSPNLGKDFVVNLKHYSNIHIN